MDNMQDEYNDSFEEPVQEQQGISDEELHAIVDKYYQDSAIFQADELSDVQVNALKRYHGKPYEDGREGEQPSQITTQEFSTHVKWIMPKYLAVFCSNSKLFSFDPQTPADAQYAKTAAEYINHIFFVENKGKNIVHDLAWNGEVMRLGVARVEYEDPEPSAPEVIRVEEGTLAMLQEGINSGELEIIENNLETQMVQDPATGEIVEAPVGGTVTVVRTPTCGNFKIRVVPPEQFLFHGTATDLKTCRYHAEQQFVFRGDLIAQFPDFEDELLEAPNFDRVLHNNKNLIAQARYDASGQGNDCAEGNANNDRTTDELELLDEFVYVDYNGDGKPELRNIKRVGNIILDNVEVECTDFAVFTPERIPHVLVGRSMYDVVGDIQDANTQLKRNAFTNHSFNSNGIVIFDKTRIDPDAMQMRSTPGANYGVNGDVTGVATTLQFPDTSAQSIALKEVNDRESEARTGMSRATQGIDPDAYGDTAKGIQLLQNAGNEVVLPRIEQLMNTLEDIGSIALRKVVANQDKAKSIYLNGEWKPIDPSPWNTKMRCVIKAGLGAANRPDQVALLGTIIQGQDALCQQYGDDNPWVTPDMRINARHEMIAAAGMGNPDAYFKNATPEEIAAFMQKKQAQPSPEQQKMQADMQMKQQEAQSKQMIEMQKLQLSREDMMEKHRREWAEFEQETELAKQKMIVSMMTGKSQTPVRPGGQVG
jgi:hypothetical protein